MSSLPPRPRKRLGQNFLIDHNIVRKILAVAGVKSGEAVLEIGPGQGILTKPLCAAARRVLAIEIDPRLHARLSETLSDCTNLELRLGDALTFDYETLPPDTVVVANLPYYISTPLLMLLLEHRRRLSRLILMVQTEVARRLAARPGTEAYGGLSVLAQFAATVRIEFQVRPTCFYPRPEVGSSVLSLVIRPEPLVPVADEELFQHVVRWSFAHRRKTILNSLRDEGVSVERAVAALDRAGIASGRRAETCRIEEFAALADALHGNSHG